MDAKKVFFWAWFWLDLSVTIIMAIALIVVYSIWGYWLAITSLLLPTLVIVALRFVNRLSVAAERNWVFEWNGEKMEPLKPGLYYPFRLFGFLNEGEEVPMNRQMLYVLTGVRDGLSLEIINQYYYGTPSNVEPNEGDYLRLMYKIEFECFDPVKLIYAVDDPYAYLVGVLELEVNKYAKGLHSEKVLDGFAEKDWTTDLLSKTTITDAFLIVGVNLISFIPVDVLVTLEVEEIRRKVQIEEKRADVIKAELKNSVIIEKGDKQILNARLANMNIREDISKKQDKIMVNSLNSIKTDVGVNSVMALKFVTQQKTLQTIAESSKNGAITYIDGSGGDGTVAQAAKIGWGIKASMPKE